MRQSGNLLNYTIIILLFFQLFLLGNGENENPSEESSRRDSQTMKLEPASSSVLDKTLSHESSKEIPGAGNISVSATEFVPLEVSSVSSANKPTYSTTPIQNVHKVDVQEATSERNKDLNLGNSDTTTASSSTQAISSISSKNSDSGPKVLETSIPGSNDKNVAETGSQINDATTDTSEAVSTQNISPSTDQSITTGPKIVKDSQLKYPTESPINRVMHSNDEFSNLDTKDKRLNALQQPITTNETVRNTIPSEPKVIIQNNQLPRNVQGIFITTETPATTEGTSVSQAIPTKTSPITESNDSTIGIQKVIPSPSIPSSIEPATTPPSANTTLVPPSGNSTDSESKADVHQFFENLRLHTAVCLLSLLLILLAGTVIFACMLIIYFAVRNCVLGLVGLCKKMKKCLPRNKCSTNNGSGFHEAGSLFPRCDVSIRPYDSSDHNDRYM